MTGQNKMPQLPTDREYTIIIICSEKSTHGTAVKFASDTSHDIYVVSRIPSCMPFLNNLLEQLVDLPKVRILLINHDPKILADVLKLIIQKSVSEHAQRRKEEYLSRYRENLTSVGGTSSSNFQAKLPPGHADFSSAFDMAIIGDSGDIDELNYLSEKYVFVQQSLRFVALKHGVRYAAISGIESLISNTNAMISLSVRLFSDSFGAELIIYKPNGVSVTDHVLLHQFIPVGWDSWSKIILVAKSVPNSSKMTRLLTAEVQLGDLNDTYDDFFSDPTPAGAPYDEKPLGLSIDRQRSQTVDSEITSRAELFQLLNIDSVQNVPLTGPAPLLNYRDFLQSLQGMAQD